MSSLRVDTISSENAGDAVAFTKGINATGVVTATTFAGSIEGTTGTAATSTLSLIHI